LLSANCKRDAGWLIGNDVTHSRTGDFSTEFLARLLLRLEYSLALQLVLAQMLLNALSRYTRLEP
jgi:hypothetical protein